MPVLSSAFVKAAISAAVITLAATCATAAQVRIKLPMQAQLGNTLLSPGEYRITTDLGSPELHVSGNGTNLTVLVAGTEPADGSPSHVTTVNVNGVPRIKELNLALLGRKYKFLTPRPSARTTMAFTLHDQPAKH